MKILTIRLLILFLTSCLATSASGKIETVLGMPLQRNSNLPGAIPDAPSSEIIISRKQYVVSYNKEKRVPNWVAWKVEARQLGNSGRSEAFAMDTELENYLKMSAPSFRAVEPTEYTDSCMDRGHLAPSADRSDTVQNNQETFLMSNMAPQTPYLNRVLWVHLEIHTRDLIRDENKRAYVIAGPIYDQNDGNIGPNRDIAVPSKFFKVIVVLDANQTWKDIGPETKVISVIMPNIDKDGSRPRLGKSSGSCRPFQNKDENRDDWLQYRADLKEIEKATGIQIFAPMPASK